MTNELSQSDLISLISDSTHSVSTGESLVLKTERVTLAIGYLTLLAISVKNIWQYLYL